MRSRSNTTSSLLDLGCGRGALGEAIRSLGFQVTGLETHTDAVEVAKGRLNRVAIADIGDDVAVATVLDGETFDYILFADVLEHVPDPLGMLRRYERYLAPGGTVVISLPNIARWDRRLAAVAGRFDYADSGVMDRTHLRFFTFRTAERLVAEAGLRVVDIRHAPGIVRAFLPLIKRIIRPAAKGVASDPGLMLRSPAYRLYEKRVLPIEYKLTGLWKEALAFRIILVATRPSVPGDPPRAA